MQKVFVGLSGGVDSAVSAALLKSQGYEVVGAFIKIWQPEFIECTWKEDRVDAMRVAAALEIPFREIDLSESYKKHVVDDMIANYKKGITPNPDVLCNEKIKFGEFFDWARREGADMVATGHYARIAEKNGKYELLRGADSTKDQSYFLYRLNQEQLAHIAFPIGNMKKSDVRKMARRFNLPNAERKDSQGLCFVGAVSIADFLARFIPLEKGPVVEADGKVIGEHDGAVLYTVGQRHGFTFRHSHAEKYPERAERVEGRTHYVTAIDVARNTIHVSMNREDAARKNARIVNVHWIGEAPRTSSPYDVEARYRETPASARLSQKGDEYDVVFEKPRIAAPGQSLVVYIGETCLGGGIIH